MATIDQERKLVLDLSIRICERLFSASSCWYGFKYENFRIISVYKWNFIFCGWILINKILPAFRILDTVKDLKKRKLNKKTLEKQIKIIKKLKLEK